MCIRDRSSVVPSGSRSGPDVSAEPPMPATLRTCLLYTSDAADDLTRVDLGGRRLFKAEDGIRDLVRSRGLGDVYKRQILGRAIRLSFGPGCLGRASYACDLTHSRCQLLWHGSPGFPNSVRSPVRLR